MFSMEGTQVGTLLRSDSTCFFLKRDMNFSPDGSVQVE